MSSSDDLADGNLVVICGPTAAGKSALAMRLADILPITIVSADSRQIYRRFDIGTAKPSAQDREKVPHAGLDLVEPTQRFSSHAWATTAVDAIARARAEGRVPVVVGGAGFYVRALVTPEPYVSRYDARYLVVDPGPVLRDWITHRVDAMLAGGWPEEVMRLDRDVPDDAPAWQASGYAAVREMVRGKLSLAQARERIVISTRQYAKRQRTWFRHQLPKEFGAADTQSNRPVEQREAAASTRGGAALTTRIDPRSPSALATLQDLVK